MKKDKYSSFAALAKGETLGRDYRTRWQDRGSGIILLAPHGGWIEPGTSKIALAIAADDLSFYLFEGMRPGRGHGALHIASEVFDEPKALELVGRTSAAIAIHGRADEGDPETICVGGLHDALRDTIMAALRDAGFGVALAKGGLAGCLPDNICNRGTGRAGVQLELPHSLRMQLADDAVCLGALSKGVRDAIADLPAPDPARG